MLTAQKVAELVVARQPVHVFDPTGMQVVYQNPASLELFGVLADFKTFLTLREVVVDILPLRHLFHLRTLQGRRAFFLRQQECAGRIVHVLQDMRELDEDLEQFAYHHPPSSDLRMLDQRALLYALAREMSRAERNHQFFQILRFEVSIGNTITSSEAADYAIAMVADILQSSLRQIDVLGHYDVGVLVVILPDTDGPGGQLAALRLQGLIQSVPLYFAKVPLILELTVGGAQFCPGDTPQSLLQRAAIAK